MLCNNINNVYLMQKQSNILHLRYRFFDLNQSLHGRITYSKSYTFLHSFLPNHVVYKDTYQQKVFCGVYSDEGNMFLSACQGKTVIQDFDISIYFLFLVVYKCQSCLRYVQMHNKVLQKSQYCNCFNLFDFNLST